MNQRQTGTADIFTRLSEQAAGTAAVAQPSHAPFFARLRDVDLPPPVVASTGDGADTLSSPPGSSPPGLDGAFAATSTAWLDPLAPPDPAWADRSVPTLDWLASTVLAGATTAPPDDQSVATASTRPAVGASTTGRDKGFAAARRSRCPGAVRDSSGACPAGHGLYG